MPLVRVRFPYLLFPSIMKRKICVFTALALVSTGFVAGQVDVEPDSFTASVTPGDSFSQDFEVSYSGSTSAPVYMSLNVFNESGVKDFEGFTYGFNESPVVVESDGSRMVSLTVGTSTALKPGNYNFSVNASASVEREVETRSGDEVNIVSRREVNDTDTLNRLREELNETREELQRLNRTGNNTFDEDSELSELRDRVEQLKSERDRLNSSLKNLTAQQDNPDSKGVYRVWLAVVAVLLSVVVVGALYFSPSRVSELKERFLAHESC